MVGAIKVDDGESEVSVCGFGGLINKGMWGVNEDSRDLFNAGIDEAFNSGFGFVEGF